MQGPLAAGPAGLGCAPAATAKAAIEAATRRVQSGFMIGS
jgi:hypothetical protein